LSALATYCVVVFTATNFAVVIVEAAMLWTLAATLIVW
jgi:hypothetical protein